MKKGSLNECGRHGLPSVVTVGQVGHVAQSFRFDKASHGGSQVEIRKHTPSILTVVARDSYGQSTPPLQERGAERRAGAGGRSRAGNDFCSVAQYKFVLCLSLSVSISFPFA